jgi:hypothetical protein
MSVPPPYTPPYSLSKVLGIKPGHTVILQNVPASMIIKLGSEVKQAHIQQTPGTDADILVCFATNNQALTDSFESLKKQIATHGALWIVWPKILADIKTDLKETVVRDIAFRQNMVDVGNCEIEHQYSALKFVYRMKDR